MNTNEIANDLDHVYELSNIFECKAGADTIRQQQSEIEALKTELSKWKLTDQEILKIRNQQAIIEELEDAIIEAQFDIERKNVILCQKEKIVILLKEKISKFESYGYQLEAPIKGFYSCVCGEPFAPNTIHKKDTPCYEAEPIAWMNVEPAYLGWDKLREDDIPLYTALIIKDLKE